MVVKTDGHDDTFGTENVYIKAALVFPQGFRTQEKPKLAQIIKMPDSEKVSQKLQSYQVSCD